MSDMFIVVRKLLSEILWNCLSLISVCAVLICGIIFSLSVISALTLLFGHQEEHQNCKNWTLTCWRGYLSGARCKLSESQWPGLFHENYFRFSSVLRQRCYPTSIYCMHLRQCGVIAQTCQSTTSGQ